MSERARRGTRHASIARASPLSSMGLVTMVLLAIAAGILLAVAAGVVLSVIDSGVTGMTVADTNSAPVFNGAATASQALAITLPAAPEAEKTSIAPVPEGAAVSDDNPSILFISRYILVVVVVSIIVGSGIKRGEKP
jgi:hypothetical protein